MARRKKTLPTPKIAAGVGSLHCTHLGMVPREAHNAPRTLCGLPIRKRPVYRSFRGAGRLCVNCCRVADANRLPLPPVLLK